MTKSGAPDLLLMEEVFAKYEGQKGVLIQVLQRAKTLYGYLPPEVLKLIADRLGLSLSKVYGVATFYAQFYLEPRGRHVLKLCDGTACHVKGTPGLISAVQQEYGVGPNETTQDFELTTEIVYCLGSCALAPAGVLDNKVIGHLRRESLLEKLKKQVSPRPETTDG